MSSKLEEFARRTLLFLAVVAWAPLVASAELELEGGGEPKLLVENARIHTPDGIAEAMAVNADGVIIALGTTTEVDRLRSGHTRLLDLKGRDVLPGFADLHVHPVFAGLQAQRCVIPQGSTLEALQQIVKACAAKAGAGKWITGGQWDASAIGRAPDRSMLDAVAPLNPALIGDTSEHSAWANSRALEIAGIGRDTPNPRSGIIERDASGQPTGVLREDAVALVRKHVPPPTDAEIRAALASSLEIMLSFGITSFTEAAAGSARTQRSRTRASSSNARVCASPGPQAMPRPRR